MSLSLKLRLAVGLLVAGLAGCFFFPGPFSLFVSNNCCDRFDRIAANHFLGVGTAGRFTLLIPAKQGVAFLARTIELHELTAADAIETKPRLCPRLLVP